MKQAITEKVQLQKLQPKLTQEDSKKHLLLEDVEEYTYDASVYLVEYEVANGFWNTVQTFDYKGITEALIDVKPEATVPVYLLTLSVLL